MGLKPTLQQIFETFGPTTGPLYQIRFNSKYPLDTTKIQVGRAVFHVPTKSNYVFVQQLRHLKGSDASNVHDEEPGEDELEFSDDEAEAAYKRAQAHKCVLRLSPSSPPLQLRRHTDGNSNADAPGPSSRHGMRHLCHRECETRT